MSAFFEKWERCMKKVGFPVPTAETPSEALEFLHQLHTAWEAAGGDNEMIIGVLMAPGAAAAINEDAIIVLGAIANVAVIVYVNQCISCLTAVAIKDLKDLFATNDLPDFVVAELENQGVDLENEANA